MRLEGIPKEVRKAQIENDHEALSAMGKKGGKISVINRSILKVQKDMAIEERVRELSLHETISPDGEVLPPEDSNPADGIVCY